MHAISSYRGNRPPHTPTHPQTGPIKIHCAAASAQCKNSSETIIPDIAYKLLLVNDQTSHPHIKVGKQ